MSSAADDLATRNTTPAAFKVTKQGSEFGLQSNGSNSGMPERQTEKLPKRENDPTALEVILGLINNEEEEKASEYMKGHVSQEIINDTFLYDAQ